MAKDQSIELMTHSIYRQLCSRKLVAHKSAPRMLTGYSPTAEERLFVRPRSISRAATKVTVRGMGPSLIAAVANALRDPLPKLCASSGAMVTPNNDLNSDANASTVQQKGVARGGQRESVTSSSRPVAYTAMD